MSTSNRWHKRNQNLCESTLQTAMIPVNTVLRQSLNNAVSFRRTLWEYLNVVFNSVNEERLKMFGPDRTCAEWILRNGGKVKFLDEKEYLDDYNKLPPEKTKLQLTEVDASDSSISHYGFPHFVGCKNITKLILHNCSFIKDDAFPLMKPLDGTLKYLQVSKCRRITSKGILQISEIQSLTDLNLFDLPIKRDNVLEELKKKLPKCNITFN